MNKLELDQTVYHVTDEEQLPGIITGIINRTEHLTTYLVSRINGEREYFRNELTDVKIIF